MRVLPLVMCAFLSIPVWCEEGDVEDLVNRGLEAYRAGRKQEAADLLQKAASLVQKEGAQGLASFLPPAPEGWTREEIDSQSGTWGSGGEAFQWTQAAVDYHHGEDHVRLTFSSSPQLIEAQRAMVDMMQNEQYRKAMNMDPNRSVDLFNRDGWAGMTQIEKGGDASIMAFTDKLMCQIEVQSGAEELLGQFADLLDWAGLAASAR